jgi:hypothetical protein
VDEVELLAGLRQGVEDGREEAHLLTKADLVGGVELAQHPVHGVDFGLGQRARVIVTEEHGGPPWAGCRGEL